MLYFLLLYSCAKFLLDLSQLTSEGQPFWSGPKRAPEPIKFNPNDVSSRNTCSSVLWTNQVTTQSQHLDYIIAGANLRAFNYGLHPTTDKNLYAKVAYDMKFPPFQAKQIAIQVSDSDPVPATTGDDRKCHPQAILNLFS